MNDSLIINVRTRLHWQKRLFSDTTTAAMWGFWLWLCRPMVGAMSILLGSHGSMSRAAIALGSTSGTLLIWNFASEWNREQPVASSAPDFESYFGLSAEEIEQGRNSRIAVLHHNDSGQIMRVVSRQ
jgi:poly-beta-1,6-N-acetyl-D-glucosamine biosynthesis protein PgaD